MDSFLQDIRYALRRLRHTPGFTLIAVLTFALGIGANTAIFSVVNAVLLQPLPYHDPDKVVMLYEHSERFPQLSVSWQNYVDWRDQSQSFAAVGVVRNYGTTLTGSGDPERLLAQMSSSNMFDLLGLTPALGRMFTPAEDTAGGTPVALIGYGLWQRRFAGNANVLGQSITLDNKPYTVIGVLPAGLQITQQPAEVLLPVGPWAKTLPDDRSWHPGLLPIARLKPNVSLEQAQAEMTTIARRLEQQYPVYDTGTGAIVIRMQDQLVGNIKQGLWLMLGAVMFVLLIACTNVANLLLARAAARQREMAIRAAIGASRLRITRQLLTESLLLAVAGALLGLALAKASTAPLLRLAGNSVPAGTVAPLDSAVLIFTSVLALVAGSLFGMVPALHTARLDLRAALNETDRGAVGGGALKMRSVLVVAEVAVAMVLLAGAGLLIRSFERLSNVGPGFTAENLLIADLPTAAAAHPKAAERMDFYDRILDRVRVLPGVTSVGLASTLPVAGAGGIIHFNIQGRPPKSPHEYILANYRVVSSGYLQTLGVPLMQGRMLQPADREGAPAAVVINQTMARVFFPNESPLGKHIQLGATPENSVPWMEIVGIVGDVKQSLASEAPTEMYVPFRQANEVLPVFFLSLVMRTTTEPLSGSNALRNAIHEVDANQPAVNVRSMQQNMDVSIAQPRFRTLLLGIFAALALLLAGVGIYGVMAYAVTQRTREIGVRVALGSTASAILKLILGQGLRLAGCGVAIGLIAALALGRSLKTMLFEIPSWDPATLIAVAAVLIGVALAACYVPARRATRVDPMIALRDVF